MEVHAPERTSQKTAQAKPATKRAVPAYETRTPEKVAIGERLRIARETKGMTATAAATEMGYSQPVQLSLMETGNRPVTIKVIMECAAMYGTTTDFLLGLTEDIDRDPAVTANAFIAARITSEVQRLIQQMTGLSIDVARKLLPEASAGQRLAHHIFEVNAAIQRFAALNPAFADDMRGGATVLRKVAEAADAATQYMGQVNRAQRAMSYRTLSEVAGKTEQMSLSLIPILRAAGPNPEDD